MKKLKFAVLGVAMSCYVAAQDKVNELSIYVVNNSNYC